MAKKVIGQVKLQIPGGQATPSPPVGPALGQHGVNIMEFCKAYNARTQAQTGTIIPVVITIYADAVFHLYNQDAAGIGSSETGGSTGQGVFRAWKNQGREGKQESG